MLSSLPVVLALLGTALMAVVIFAPVPLPATVTMSFAPPVAGAEHRALDLRSESYRPSPLDVPTDPAAAPPQQRDADPFRAPHRPLAAAWPSRVDPRAAACDAAARIALVEALATVGCGWANEILGEALAGEPDAAVRAAIERAIRA